MYYDRKGKPFKGTPKDPHGTLEWAKKFEDFGYRRVGETKLFRGWVQISTVWLGLDHSYSETSLPIIFESMVFIRNPFTGDWPVSLESQRYTSEERAALGHAEFVLIYSDGWYTFKQAIKAIWDDTYWRWKIWKWQPKDKKWQELKQRTLNLLKRKSTSNGS